MDTKTERNKMRAQLQYFERAGLKTLAQAHLLLCLAEGDASGTTLVDISIWTGMSEARCSASLFRLKYYGFTANSRRDGNNTNVFWALTQEGKAAFSASEE